MTNLPPHVDLSKQRTGTRALFETTVGVWALKLLDPKKLLVEVMGTHQAFHRSSRPVVGQFIESVDPTVADRFAKGCLVKGWPFSIRFQDAVLIAEPVQSILLEGDRWKYEI